MARHQQSRTNMKRGEGDDRSVVRIARHVVIVGVPPVEREYFRCTGIFPIMHTVVVRKELAKEPELLRAVFEGFCKAKDGMIEQYD